MNRETVWRYAFNVSIFTVAIGALTTAFTREQKEVAVKKRGSECQRCRSPQGVDDLFAHHILPVQMGGADTLPNLYLVCSDCHQEVDRLVEEEGDLATGGSILELHPEFDADIVANRNKLSKFQVKFGKKRKRVWE